MQPKVNEIVDSKAMMKRLQAEIVQLRRQLVVFCSQLSIQVDELQIPTVTLWHVSESNNGCTTVPSY